MSVSVASDSDDTWRDLDAEPESAESDEWIPIGYVPDRITADFVMDSLKSYEIPAALNSKSGFFGTVGMTGLELPFSGGSGAYEILTIAEKAEEASDIASMIAGGKWEPVDPVE